MPFRSDGLHSDSLRLLDAILPLVGGEFVIVLLLPSGLSGFVSISNIYSGGHTTLDSAKLGILTITGIDFELDNLGLFLSLRADVIDFLEG